MFLLLPRKLFLSPHSNSSRSFLMSSKDFLLLKFSATPGACAHVHLLNSCSSSSQALCFDSSCRKNSRIFPSPKHTSPSNYRASDNGHTPYSSMSGRRPIDGADVWNLEKQFVDEKQLAKLREKLQEMGIDGSCCTPGIHNGLICPNCKGGDSHEKSLSLRVKEDGSAAAWMCFRAKCGWTGNTCAFANAKSTYTIMNKITKIKQPPRVINERSLGLEPLCNELLAYFTERMISGETLRRNGIMQKRNGDQVAIAFPYRRNGELVSCKYRDIKKRFWQEANTEKIFYGLDDIKEASDIIIVEGEIDKLSMEEAGFKNCVSVPDGAPPKASDKDTHFQYIWNCKDYFDKASRIILATDSDIPGQALAEKLAHRLGGERCWWVHWPKKDEDRSYRDANEVLKNLGADALRDAVDTAKSYQMQNSE